jgi:hypothetical protein
MDSTWSRGSRLRRRGGNQHSVQTRRRYAPRVAGTYKNMEGAMRFMYMKKRRSIKQW